ncbi:MAG: hypothetical protein HC788_02825 [Sphingopyxis sp.]|nr:hypothetical protein [Sphingopyxis sp.]
MMRWLAILAALFAAQPVAASPVPAAEVRQALVEVGDSIANSVLDDQGRARGDYDWQAGRWNEYEVALARWSGRLRD